MTARMIFLTVTFLGVIGILFLGSWLTARIFGTYRRKVYAGLIILQAVLIAGCAYYQIAQAKLFGTPTYAFWRLWTTETYGILLGLAVNTAILGIIALVSLVYKKLKKRQQRKALAKQVATSEMTGDSAIAGEADKTATAADAALAAQIASDQAEAETMYFKASRRAFLKGSLLAVPALTAGAGAYRAYEGSKKLITTEHTLTFQSLPTYLKGYRIVQISDIHLGPFIDLNDFDEIMKKVLELKPNRLVITGDLIDQTDWLNPLCQRLEVAFKQIPDGIDYIPGNHEYFHNIVLILEAFSKISMRVHRNSSLRLSNGSWPVYLAGVDYPFSRTEKQQEAYLKEALSEVPQEAFVILLAHHPDFIKTAFEHDIPVTMAGHTHGGQIVIGGEPVVPVGTKYWKGMYRDSWKYGYVNNGSGHWFPVRYNCPREITLYTFVEGNPGGRV